MEKNVENHVVAFYETKDNQLASLLYASDMVLDSNYWEGSSCHFVFEDKQKCENVIADYYRGKIVLNVKLVFEAISTIKGIILSRKK